MIETMLILLILFQVKHWYIDFVNQDMEEVNHKGIYMDWRGVKHSVKHGLGTIWCLWVICGSDYILFALVMGAFDFLVHYHVDWTKMNFGNRDINDPKFWNHLGLDQMAHQITYIAIAGVTVL